MQKDWDDFWISFLDYKKLNTKISELNTIDDSEKTESICRKIYYQYDEYKEILEKIRRMFVQEIEHFSGVHLQTSRTKSIESLLEKIVNKRYENLLNRDSLYSTISPDNFSSIITDMVGVRTIIGYRGEWSQLHSEIIEKFPYKALSEYADNRFIQHKENEQFIAEIPKVYYSDGDDLSIYENKTVKCILKDSGYRSVHYVISFMNAYIELQTRTIYDEAWSDCDHRYVYKHEENRSHHALQILSDILCKNTNASNDLGDLMHKVFSEEGIIDSNDGSFFFSDKRVSEIIDGIAIKYGDSLRKLERFKERLKERTTNDE